MGSKKKVGDMDKLVGLGYETLNQWEEDLKLFKDDADNKDLLTSIVIRYNNTNSELKLEIEDRLMEFMFKYRPLALMYRIIENKPDLFICIKSDDDIWFHE